MVCSASDIPFRGLAGGLVPSADCVRLHLTAWREIAGHIGGDLGEGHPVKPCGNEGLKGRVGQDGARLAGAVFGDREVGKGRG